MKAFDVGGTTLFLALFSDVTNSKELLDLMQAGTLEPEIALLNALLIPDVFPVLAAAHKTLVAKSRGALTTRTLHSELVYNYSGSKHVRSIFLSSSGFLYLNFSMMLLLLYQISESLKRCGISDSTSYILVARFGASPDEVTAIKELIKGAEINLEELEGRANQAQIQKHYKIPALELGISSLADAITCRIAARDAL
ncbi:EKC KEOPS complex subunit Tprkb [Olea europaea subsp. europaea]|uniref:EKC KEOPS complex subunit Tprkb n=1 Tax=Olea europaea subsp. europaea TaxID=158383 RepID=A0A8S0SQ30_OLEEU|nr:EKC KEOPS complex subunit Tprkb [Olea europaea subsp. europaea]